MHGFLVRLRIWCNRKPKPLALVIFIDILVTGAALFAFALYYFLIPRTQTGIGKVSMRPGLAASAATLAPTVETSITVASAEPTAVPEATAAMIAMVTAEPAVTVDPVGYFGTKLADQFIAGEAQTTNDGASVTYVSENVRITGTKVRANDSNVYVADIYVRDISSLSAGFADGEYGRGLRDWAKKIAAENGAIVAINGDYYGARSTGVVIRNGMLYRDEYSDGDVCVLYWDGTMEAFSPSDFDVDAAMANGAYQAWCFGPMLLDGNGTPLTDFNTTVGAHNPRTVIGYYEPGHYCFVVVDGRSDESAGMTMTELAGFMSDLGCKQAYNLDGGQTSVMTWGGKVVSVPYDGGRKTSDIVMVVD